MDSVFPTAEALTHDLTFFRLCKNQHGAPRKCLDTSKFLIKRQVFDCFWSWLQYYKGKLLKERVTLTFLHILWANEKKKPEKTFKERSV